MTFIVPFDGSGLAEAALVRAIEFHTVLEESVMAVSVIPKGNTGYARDRGWIGPNEEFDLETIISRLHYQVTELCPSAEFRYVIVNRNAPSETIVKRIRTVAKQEDVSMIFIGSDNAGRIVTSVSSVGADLASSEPYDVVIVRHRRPAKIEKLKTISPHRQSKSDFYLS